MANNSAGVYDGLPFSYLTNTSPTEKQPPRSPRLSSRSDHNERGEPVGEAEPPEQEPERRPFTYLTPNSPTERDHTTGGPASPTEQPYPQQQFDGHPARNDTYDYPTTRVGDNSRRLPRDGNDPFPDPSSVRIGSDPTYYTPMKESNNPRWDNHDRSRSTSNPQENPSRGYLGPESYGQQGAGYELGGYSSFPRPKVGDENSYPGDTNYTNNQDFQNSNRGYDAMPSKGLNGKPRPRSRDSYLDSGLKRSSCCNWRVSLMALLLIILALGAGFAAGWFVSKSVNGSSESDTSDGDDSNTTVTTTTLLAAITTATTTASVSTQPDPTTKPTTASMTTIVTEPPPVETDPTTTTQSPAPTTTTESTATTTTTPAQGTTAQDTSVDTTPAP